MLLNIGEVFTQALGIMGKGMLGIFTVIVIIALIVQLLSKVTEPRGSGDKKQ